MDEQWQQQEKVRPGNEASIRLSSVRSSCKPEENVSLQTAIEFLSVSSHWCLSKPAEDHLLPSLRYHSSSQESFRCNQGRMKRRGHATRNVYCVVVKKLMSQQDTIFSQPPTRGGWSRLIKIHVSLCFLCKPIQAAESALFIYFLRLARLSLLYNISC